MSRAITLAVAALVISTEAPAQIATPAPPPPAAAPRGIALTPLPRAPRAPRPPRAWSSHRFRMGLKGERTVLDSAKAMAFLDALTQSAPAVCEMAVDNLGNWGWNDGSRALRDQSAATRSDRTAFGRAEVSDDAVPALSSGLSRADACSRRAAARLLGQSDLVSASRALREAARSNDGRVREAALLGIGIREDSANYSTAIQALEDRDPEVVRMAAWAVGEFERPASVPQLLPLLRRSEPGIRMAAAGALGAIEDARATGDLVRLLADKEEGVRLSAIWALAGLEDPAAVPGLAGLLTDPSTDVRLAAVEALGGIESSTVTSHLIAAMKDRDAEVRRAAAEALGNR